MTPSLPIFKKAITFLLAVALCLPTGTLCHEVIGHGLTGILAGGRIVSVDVLFLQLWPALQLHGWRGTYGTCNVEGIPTPTGDWIMQLGGSVSTLIASAAALLVLRMRRWSFPARAALLAIGVWWIDILTYTLPTWGIRRSIFWGGRYAEPYEAAVALGVPGPIFQAGVVLISIAAACLWFQELLRRPVGPDRINAQ